MEVEVQPEEVFGAGMPAAKKKISMKFEKFALNREYSRTSSIVQTFNADFLNSEFCQKDIREHTGCINALSISHNQQLLATGGDDLNCRVWRFDDLMTRKNPAPIMTAKEEHDSNIFSLVFTLDDRCIYSGERHGLIMKHDVETGQRIYLSVDYRQKADVYDLHHHPFDSNLIVATHARLITFIDDRDRGKQTAFLAANDPHSTEFYTAKFHPESPALLLISSDKGGAKVYDRRNPTQPLFQQDVFQGYQEYETTSMGAHWSPSGNQYMTIRKSKPPLYFDLISKQCFELKTEEAPMRYRNSKTIKSMAFIDDYTVATGSDHWGIHIWRVPRANDDSGYVRVDVEDEEGPYELYIEKEARILRGHRSIPNQIVFSKQNQLLISSGVENSFKLWSHCRLPWSYDIPFQRRKRGRSDRNREREINREREERRLLEDALERDGEMEGRACWEDIFGGNVQTAESRETLEMFDILIGDEEEEDEEDEEEEEGNNGVEDEDMWDPEDIHEPIHRHLRFIMRHGELEAERYLQRMEAGMDRELLEFLEMARRDVGGDHVQFIDESDPEDEEDDEEQEGEEIEIDDDVGVEVISDEEEDEGDDEGDNGEIEVDGDEPVYVYDSSSNDSEPE